MSSTRVKSSIKLLTFCLLAAISLTPVSLTGAHAQISGVTVGNWPLGQIQPSGYETITPDTTGVNSGIVSGTPQPTLVDGKFGQAMQFNGNNIVYIPIKFVVGFPPMPQPMYVSISSNLDIQKYFQVDAWINLPGYKNATYNNILVKCNHPDQACSWQNTVRILGLAIRAGVSEKGVVQGSLSGYLLTNSGGANEIVTTQPVPLNQWVEVEFTRDTTGLHLYVNGDAQSVNIVSGVQDPEGNIVNGTEYYIGHDGLATIQDVKLVDLNPPHASESAFDIGPNIMVSIIVVSVIFAIAWLMRRLIQLWLIRPKV